MSRVRVRAWFVMLLIPYVALLVAAYWLFVDTKPPLIVIYSHPHFLSAPASSREEAKELEVTRVKSGTPRLYRYLEACMSRAQSGVLLRSWEASGFVWNAPASWTTTPAGCWTRNIEVQPPTSNPTRTFLYHSKAVFTNNPLYDSVVEMPAIEITVEAN